MVRFELISFSFCISESRLRQAMVRFELISFSFCISESRLRQAMSRGYDRLWCVLKDRTIHIFKEKDNRNEDTVVGSLTIDDNTECKYTESDRDGYKFELHTIGPYKTTRANRFKTRKKVEREMWRAYIVGLSKGRVPNDLDLLDSQVDELKPSSAKKLLESVVLNPSLSGADLGIKHCRKEPPCHGQRTAGLRPLVHTLDLSEVNVPRLPVPGTQSVGAEGGLQCWFFSICNRDLAEKVLVNSGQYGNTLMRESSSQKSSGSYVISKIGKIDGEVRIEHFEVERIDRGYRIKVENDHEPQKNLVAVMNTFRFIAGYENTIPMKTNDLSELGLTEEDANPYHLKRIERELPAISRELPEPLPDYEEPMQRPKTFNPGILKKEKAMYERKRTPSPPEFDPPAPHRESVYYNAPDSDTVTSSLQNPHVQIPSTPSPPPPHPHTPGSRAYYNEEEFKDLKGKEPYRKRSMSVPNVKYPMPAVPIEIDFEQPAVRDVAPPKSVVPNAPPPPTTIAPPPLVVTSPTQKTPASILKTDKRSLPSIPPTPNEEPRSSIETTALTAAQLGLKPTKTNQRATPSASSGFPQSDYVPTPQQLGLRPVKNVNKKDELSTKEYEEAKSIQDIRRRFEKKIPPSTAPKPTTKARPKDNKRHSVSSLSLTNFPHHVSNEIKNISPHRFTNKSQKPSLRHSAPVMHVNSQEYSNLSDIETLKTSDEEEEETYNDAISVALPKRSSFIRKLEQQIGVPAVGPMGSPKVPEIKPMTEEEEQFYDSCN
ncbi:proteoglycan 4-like isoform X3 [Ostrea edulis]|uniref:proteoglycan 4-like isoform X3 n=1 Tax=Ostrea edulis TaxID=37623 RepID=UPI0024AEE3F7|nr:proteoglycan 4-like isoform X3 [Ostrea edulis]